MKANGLKKLLINGFLLLAILFVADRAIGWWLNKSYYQQEHGDDVVTTYVAEQAKEDILILGGSRASHHYITTAVEQATGQSCYNGGRDDMDIIYISAMLELVTKRYIPKTLVLDITPLELAEVDNRRVATQRASTVLLPLTPRHPELFSTVNLVGDIEETKAKISHIYPFNSLVGSIFQNTYTKLGHESIKGYEPMHGAIDPTIYKESAWGEYVKPYELNKTCVERLDQVIAIAKKHHIRLITIVSPFYFPFDFYTNKCYLELKNKIEGNGFEFYDFSHAAPYLHNPTLFKDDIHLNDTGAKIYSKEIADIINRQAQ